MFLFIYISLNFSKIFLHDPSEIPFMKYAGSAVPIGMDALMPIEMLNVRTDFNRKTNCFLEKYPYFNLLYIIIHNGQCASFNQGVKWVTVCKLRWLVYILNLTS